MGGAAVTRGQRHSHTRTIWGGDVGGGADEDKIIGPRRKREGKVGEGNRRMGLKRQPMPFQRRKNTLFIFLTCRRYRNVNGRE